MGNAGRLGRKAWCSAAKNQYQFEGRYSVMVKISQQLVLQNWRCLGKTQWMRPMNGKSLDMQILQQKLSSKDGEQMVVQLRCVIEVSQHNRPFWKARNLRAEFAASRKGDVRGNRVRLGGFGGEETVSVNVQHEVFLPLLYVRLLRMAPRLFDAYWYHG